MSALIKPKSPRSISRQSFGAAQAALAANMDFGKPKPTLYTKKSLSKSNSRFDDEENNNLDEPEIESEPSRAQQSENELIHQSDSKKLKEDHEEGSEPESFCDFVFEEVIEKIKRHQERDREFSPTRRDIH